MGIFNLFGNKKKKLIDFKERGAIVLDVRTKAEHLSGAISGSKNIALSDIESRISEVKKWNKPIITYCAAGMRSAKATNILNSHGIEAMNGGGYAALKNKL